MVIQKINKHRMGPGGYCICPKCGHKAGHTRGNPCQNFRCPVCSSRLMRENSFHHLLVKQKKTSN